MADELQDFLAGLATDPVKLGAYVADPEAAMRDARLGDRDRAVLRSGDGGAIYGRLTGATVTQREDEITPYPPGDTEYPPGATEYPPGDTHYPPGDTHYPPGTTEYPPGATHYAPADTHYPPADTEYPPGETEYPPADTHYPPEETSS